MRTFTYFLLFISAAVVEVPPFARNAPGRDIASIRSIVHRRHQDQHVCGAILLGRIPYMVWRRAAGGTWVNFGPEDFWTEHDILTCMAQGDYLGAAFQKMQKRLYSQAYMQSFFADEARHVPNHFLPANAAEKEKLEVLMTKLLRGYNLVGNPFVKIAYSNPPRTGAKN